MASISTQGSSYQVKDRASLTQSINKVDEDRISEIAKIVSTAIFSGEENAEIVREISRNSYCKNMIDFLQNNQRINLESITAICNRLVGGGKLSPSIIREFAEYHGYEWIHSVTGTFKLQISGQNLSAAANPKVEEKGPLSDFRMREIAKIVSEKQFGEGVSIEVKESVNTLYLNQMRMFAQSGIQQPYKSVY